MPHLAVLVVGLSLAGCGEEAERGPVLNGFSCGGIAGYMCPPGSTCDSCSNPDCMMACYAVTPCNPGSPGCPSGTQCDAATRYCIPGKTCTAHAECAAWELCVTQHLSKGLCMTVAPAPASSCASCSFPWFCTVAGNCVLNCLDGERCPGALRCVDHRCVP